MSVAIDLRNYDVVVLAVLVHLVLVHVLDYKKSAVPSWVSFVIQPIVDRIIRRFRRRLSFYDVVVVVVVVVVVFKLVLLLL